MFRILSKNKEFNANASQNNTKFMILIRLVRKEALIRFDENIFSKEKKRNCEILVKIQPGGGMHRL